MVAERLSILSCIVSLNRVPLIGKEICLAYAAVRSYLPYRGAVVASSDGNYSVTLNAPTTEITDSAIAVINANGTLSFGLAMPAIRNESVSLYNYTIR